MGSVCGDMKPLSRHQLAKGDLSCKWRFVRLTDSYRSVIAGACELSGFRFRPILANIDP